MISFWNNKIKPHLIEIMIVSVIFSLSLGLTIYFALPKKGVGEIAVIRKQNEIVYKIDLSTVEDNKEWVIEGTHTQVIAITKDKAISIKELGCPSQYCVHSGWISHPGESLICAYNGIIITIEGDSGASAHIG